MHRVFVVIATSFALAGCVTKPIAAESATLGQVLAFQQPPAGTHGTITIVRDAGAFGSACSTELSVEGKPAAILEQGQKVVLYLGTGRQTLGAIFKGGMMCGTEAAKEQRRSDLEIYIEAGDVRAYRISITSAGLDIRPAPVR